MKKFSLLLLDANVVIEISRQGLWDQIRESAIASETDLFCDMIRAALPDRPMLPAEVGHFREALCRCV